MLIRGWKIIAGWPVAHDTKVAVGDGSSGSSSLPPPTPPSSNPNPDPSAPALVLPAPVESSGGELLTKGPPHLGFPDRASPGLGCIKGNRTEARRPAWGAPLPAPRPRNPRALRTRRGLQEVRRPEWAVRRETGEPGQGLGGGDGLWFGEIERAPTQVEITSWRSFLGG